MSFWDAKQMEEQRRKQMEQQAKKRAEDERRRRDEQARQAAKKKKKLKLQKLNKQRQEEEEEAERLALELEGKEESEEQPKQRENFIPPPLNRGFGFQPGGGGMMSQSSRDQIKKNEVELQKKAQEEADAKGSAEDIYSGPRLNRGF